jgi:hypothetical protein
MHRHYVINLLDLHIKILIYKLNKGNKMIKNILSFLNTPYVFNVNNFDNVDPQLIRYFRNEYGTDWKSALTEHLYKKVANDDKKAA